MTGPHPALYMPSEDGMPFTIFIRDVRSSSTFSREAPAFFVHSTISVSGDVSAVYGSTSNWAWMRYSKFVAGLFGGGSYPVDSPVMSGVSAERSHATTDQLE